ncbi:MAG: hypothetical protein P4M14_03255 [Gammaproteobacteria bacterium]|nr:hypothetical protein [Gammaproteobacteria bacterium]
MRIAIIALLFLTRLAIADTLYTSRDFQHDITTHPKIIFYFVSGGMPLSMPGLKNTLEVAKIMGYEVQPLNDPVEPIRSWGGQSIPIAVPASYTSAAGVPLHFPIILVYKNGHPCGPAIPGYKSLKGYQEIISLYDQQCESSRKTIQSQLVVHHFHTANIILETPIPRENIAYYFKPINNDWVTYHASKQVYFFNRKTGTEFMTPGQFDSVPTPDAQFLTIPAPLRFFSLAKIWADPHNATNLQPDFSDPNMKDEYQSIGIVNDSQSIRTYRVATAWIAAVGFRDYSLNKETGDITPENQPKTVCKGFPLSLPMLSKNGLMLGGHSNGDAFTKIVSIGASGAECKLVQDLGFKTGKVAFSHDGDQVAFVTKDGDAINAYVYNLKTKSLTLLMTVSEAKNEYIVFPDFLPNGNVLAMKVQRSSSGSVHSTLFEMHIGLVT